METATLNGHKVNLQPSVATSDPHLCISPREHMPFIPKHWSITQTKKIP